MILGTLICSHAHDEFFYDLKVKSVNSANGNLVLTGTLIFEDREYEGDFFPLFRVFGIKDSPHIGCELNRHPIKIRKEDNKIYADFVFNMRKRIGYALSKDGVKVKSYISKVPEGKHLLYTNLMAGQLVPIAEVHQHGERSIYIYLHTRYPTLNPKDQSLKEVDIPQKKSG